MKIRAFTVYMLVVALMGTGSTAFVEAAYKTCPLRDCAPKPGHSSCPKDHDGDQSNNPSVASKAGDQSKAGSLTALITPPLRVAVAFLGHVIGLRIVND